MKTKFLVIICFLLIAVGIINSVKLKSPARKLIQIGILVPMEHTALREIVAGFKHTVEKEFPDAVSFNVQNAQGDLKLQRSIIEMFIGQKMDLIVPIGTNATQMTLSLVKKQPIVSLAATLSEAERKKRDPINVTGILDEIGGQRKLDFLRDIFSELKNLTLIVHSGNEKNFQEVEELRASGEKMGITIQTIQIQNLPELEMAARSISSEANALMILKDHLLASGIRLLVPIADKLQIPLIASDEGSVINGAALALGVRERAIGEEGGRLAVKVLMGHKMTDLPLQQMKELTVFYNASACGQQRIDLQSLERTAAKQAYPLLKMDN